MPLRFSAWIVHYRHRILGQSNLDYLTHISPSSSDMINRNFQSGKQVSSVSLVDITYIQPLSVRQLHKSCGNSGQRHHFHTFITQVHSFHFFTGATFPKYRIANSPRFAILVSKYTFYNAKEWNKTKEEHRQRLSQIICLWPSNQWCNHA